MPRKYELKVELDDSWDSLPEEAAVDLLEAIGEKHGIKIMSIGPLQEKRARISKITIKHLLDEISDLSWLETTPEYHYGKDGHGWDHVPEEEKQKVIAQYGSIWDACVAYAKQDKERLAAFNRGDWHMIGIMAEAEVHIPEDTIPGPSWLIQHITSGGLWGIESDSDKEHFTEGGERGDRAAKGAPEDAERRGRGRLSDSEGGILMDLFICTKCRANLIEKGLVEATIGGVSRTMFRFKNKKAEHDDTCLGDFDDQWVECGACGAELHDRTASEIIEAYENDLPHTRDDEEQEEE